MAGFALGLIRFGLTVVLAVLVVFVTYRIFIKANTDFDEEEQIKKGNVSVGILVAALLVASANIFYQALTPLLNLLSARWTSQAQQTVGPWTLALYAVGHLALAFVLAVSAISFSLRMFGRLTRSRMRMGAELYAGNVAVGLVLSGVVFIVALYIGEGVNALSKTLIPQPGVTRMKVMR